MKYIILIAFVFLLASCGGEATFDSANPDDSLKLMTESMSNEKAEEFGKSYAGLFIKAGIANMMSEDDAWKHLLYKELHGKTAQEIIDYSNAKLEADNKERSDRRAKERAEAQRQIELVNKIKIEIIKSEVPKMKVLGDKEYTLKFTNGTNEQIAYMSLGFKAMEDGRDVPWVEEEAGVSFEGGLMPGESVEDTVYIDHYHVPERAKITKELFEVHDVVGPERKMITSKFQRDVLLGK